MTPAQFKTEISEKVSRNLWWVIIGNARYMGAGLLAVVFFLAFPLHNTTTLIVEVAGILALAYGAYRIVLFLKSREVVIIQTGLDVDENRKLVDAIATSYGWTFVGEISYMEFIGLSKGTSDLEYTVLVLPQPNQIHMHLQPMRVNSDILNKRARIIKDIDRTISERKWHSG